ncbi:MAG TPA: carboxypeptidase-like regulatory domain-containing protein [Longimicrobiaceae bacterium]|nr:carboxypeptidase-like regulatory domain-containing protein [Longimicrobiaceae bacterium]
MRRTSLGVAALVGGALLAGCEGRNEFPDQPLATGEGRLGSIVGQVTAAGAAVRGAEVSVANGPSAFTDAAGQYRIVGLSRGVYAVTLGAPPGFAFAVGDSATRVANVVPGNPVILNWQLVTGVGAR